MTTLMKTPTVPTRTVPLPELTAQIKAVTATFKRAHMELGRLLLIARDQHFGGRANKEFAAYVEKHVTSPLTGETPALGTVKQWIKAAGTALADKKAVRARTTSRNEVVDRRSPAHPDHKPSWEKQVRETQNSINVERLIKDREDAAKREEATRKLAKKIIQAGYRALSAVCHPDKKGGSAEAFKALNEAKKWLLESVE